MVGARRCTLGGSNAAEGSRQVPDVTRCHNRTEIYPINIFMAPTMLRMIASGGDIAQLMHFVWCVTKKFALVHKKRVVFPSKYTGACARDFGHFMVTIGL